MTKLTETTGHVTPSETRNLTPFDELDQMFDSMLNRGFFQPLDWAWGETPLYRNLHERMPKIDVIDRDDSILIRAETPGVKKEDLEVDITGDRLSIKGQTREETEERGEFYRSEIRHGSFSRTITLPRGVDGAQATANFKDGLLEITLPKTEVESGHKVDID
jgi:HSP20 family protein